MFYASLNKWNKKEKCGYGYGTLFINNREYDIRKNEFGKTIEELKSEGFEIEIQNEIPEYFLPKDLIEQINLNEKKEKE